MRSLVLPRLSSTDLFATALLATLGVGCNGDVVVSDGTGGSGGGSSSSIGPGGTTSSTMTTTSTGTGTGGCVNPMPVLVNGQDTGLDTCDGGQFRRREAKECPTNYPDTNECCGGCPVGKICNTQGEVACTCIDACTNDSQCGDNQLCMCGDPSGVCVGGTCASGADCGAGQECTSWDSSLGCLFLSFACTTPADTCGGDADCNTPPDTFCAIQPDGHRACQAGGCAIGRPFLVDEVARMAPLTCRADWVDSDTRPALEGLSADLRGELARAWGRVGQMEHASIAAFARFSLQLLSLGAPPELIERTNAAMIDETRHARVAFAFASAYGDAAVGPAALAIDGALAPASAADIVRLAIREGCVGETVAAFEAGEAAARATDPVLKRALEMIARDESSHAELAWRFVTWAARELGEDVGNVVREELAALSREPNSLSSREAYSSSDEDLLAYGVASDHARSVIRRTTIRDVVTPCLEALFCSGAVESLRETAMLQDVSCASA